MTNETQTLEERIKTEQKAVRAIINNYKGWADSLAQQLTLETPNHHLTTGSYREEVWKTLFMQIVPRKFHIEQGVFIIDSNGQISDEVDLAIFDESYTPYIFKLGKIKFIPIEAVAVAVQCKSTNIDGVKKWAETITRLRTAFDSVTRIMGGLSHNNLKNALDELENVQGQAKHVRTMKLKSQTSTRPILILCSLVEGRNPADPGREGTILHKNAASFDIVLNIDKENKLSKVIPNEHWDYRDWYKELNHYGLNRYGQESSNYEKLVLEHEKPFNKTMRHLEIGPDEENVILSLTFQLNQLLMLINNPMFFPHQSYVEMFCKHLAAAESEASSKRKRSRRDDL